VPGTVIVPEGQSSVTFPINHIPVGSKRVVYISARSGDTEQTSTLTLLPPALKSVSAPTTAVGGTKIKATVTLDAPAPVEGLRITVKSSNTSVAKPEGVLVVFAGKTKGSINFSTLKVTQPTTVTLTFTRGNVTKTVQVNVTPN